jgi:transposase
MDLTDAQWAVLEPTSARAVARMGAAGRPWTDPRAVMNGVLWVLRTGAPWHDLPSLAIVASNSGSARAASIDCCNASPTTSGTAVLCHSKRDRSVERIERSIPALSRFQRRPEAKAVLQGRCNRARI